MCLGLPGRVVEIQENEMGMVMGKVSFPDNVQQVCLSYLPDVRIGDYVMVHFGFATEKLDPRAALDALELREQLDQLFTEEEP